MRRVLRSAAFVLLISPAVALLAAQEAFAPKKHENVNWFWMTNVKFKPGKIDEALKIINERFAPAGSAVGMTGVRTLYHTGGEWDLTLLFPAAEGPRSLEWALSPEDAKWMGEMAKREKGMANVTALLSRYSDLVAREEGILVREPR
jgi:hypothetical protein